VPTTVGLYDYTGGLKYSVYLFDSDSDYMMSGIYSGLTSDFVVPKGKYFILQAASKDNIKITTDDYGEVNGRLNAANEALTSIGLDVGLLRNRLVKLESANAVPSYYETHMAEKCATINGLVPASGVQFAFVTDTHINTYSSALHAKALLNYLSKNTFVDTVVCGGDVASGFYDGRPTAPQYAQLLRDGYEYSSADNDVDLLFVAGNHDTGVDYSSSGDASTPLLSPDLLARNTRPKLYHKSNFTCDANSKLNYFCDDVENKIHYIVLSACLRAYDSSFESYTKEYKWLCEALLACPDGYTIILFNHCIFNHSTDTAPIDFISELLTVCDQYNARGTSPLYAGDASTVTSFASCAGTVACLIGGHTHLDMSTASDGGIPVIVTTTDNCGGESSNSTLERTLGTVTEQAFDVFTIDTANKTIHCTRIGAGEDRTFAYS
jgi:predicted MPP superfamily phosphohydrolase